MISPSTHQITTLSISMAARKVTVDHCKGRYPRELGVPWRRNHFKKEIIKNPVELLNEVNNWNTVRQKNTYISVYAFRDIRSDLVNIQILKELRVAEPELSKIEIMIKYTKRFENIVNRDSAIIDCFYLDFDDETDPLNAIIEGREIVKQLKEYGVESRIYWSGNKGIALYIDFKPIYIQPQNIKPIVAQFNIYVQNRFKPIGKPVDNQLRYLDESTRDGQSRTSKLPNTRHKSSGLYCIPLLESDLWKSDALAHIRALAQTPRTDIDLEGLIKRNEILNAPIMHPLIRKIEVYVIEKRQAHNHAKNIINSTKPHYTGGGEWKKCAGVRHAEENGQVMPGREPTADGLILAYKIWGKYPIEKTKELLKVWIETKCHPARDYPLIEDRINKFYAQEKTYSPCTFLMKYGHCEGSTCSFKRRMPEG